VAVTRQAYINASGAQTFNIVTLTDQALPITLLNDDRYIIYNGIGGAVPAVNLPATPNIGQVHYFGDDSGHLSATTQLIVSGNGNLIVSIEGGVGGGGTASTYAINLKYRHVAFEYQATGFWTPIAMAGPITLNEGASTSRRVSFSVVHTVVSTAVGSSTPQIIGATYWDPTDIPVRATDPSYFISVNFRVILSTTNGSNQANIDLIDVNNIIGNGINAEVPGSNLGTIITTAPTLIQTSLTNPTILQGPGVLAARLWINPQAAGQQATCYMARIDIDYNPSG
jgi:hypothetical protein